MRGLVESIQDKNAILFVGAGVSMNLGLPSWNSLMDYIAKELEYEPEVFKSFGNALTLAEYYKIKKGDIGSLRSWMDRNWHSSDIKIENSKIHKLIFDLDFPIIYTTNYDRWIERTYDCYKKKYKKITNVGDLVNLNSMLTQIIKFHGDFDDEKSIVLTESSYFERLDFETPLDIKLRSDILGKSILFIGYSLHDINLRYLLYKLNKLWENSNQSSSRPKSYIFLVDSNPVEDLILEKRGIKTFTSKNKNPSESLLEFLEKLNNNLSE